MEPLPLNLIGRELEEGEVMNGKQESERNRQW